MAKLVAVSRFDDGSKPVKNGSDPLVRGQESVYNIGEEYKGKNQKELLEKGLIKDEDEVRKEALSKVGLKERIFGGKKEAK